MFLIVFSLKELREWLTLHNRLLHYLSPHSPPNIINKLTTPRNVMRVGHLDHLVHTTHTKLHSGNLEVDGMVMLNLELQVGNVCVDWPSVGSRGRLF